MLTVLRRIMQEVSNAPSLSALLDTIVLRVKQQLDVDVCSLYLFDEDQRRYVLMATEGLHKHGGKVSLGASEGIIALVGNREEPLT